MTLPEMSYDVLKYNPDCFQSLKKILFVVTEMGWWVGQEPVYKLNHLIQRT
jgi:hypothetical protein